MDDSLLIELFALSMSMVVVVFVARMDMQAEGGRNQMDESIAEQGAHCQSFQR